MLWSSVFPPALVGLCMSSGLVVSAAVAAAPGAGGMFLQTPGSHASDRGSRFRSGGSQPNSPAASEDSDSHPRHQRPPPSFSSSSSGPPLSRRLQQILSQAGTGPYDYPTSLTQGILPKALHSHNDYWRPVPLFSALASGAVSVEADVWLVNGSLLVGHTPSALSASRTFSSLYVEPLLETLKAQNPTTDFVDGNDTRNGVFDVAPWQTLYLWVDVKTAGAETFAAVVAALQPLRDAGYLTRYESAAAPSSSSASSTPSAADDAGSSSSSSQAGRTAAAAAAATAGRLVLGPVTVIGTGNTPLSSVLGISPRDYFWDAPLDQLAAGRLPHITRDVSPVASADFTAAVLAAIGDDAGDGDGDGDGSSPPGRGRRPSRNGGGPLRARRLTAPQLAALRKHVAAAHARGIGVRYWELPGWPVGTRNWLWRLLWDEGVDLVNVDDLDAAAALWDGEA